MGKFVCCYFLSFALLLFSADVFSNNNVPAYAELSIPSTVHKKTVDNLSKLIVIDQEKNNTIEIEAFLRQHTPALVVVEDPSDIKRSKANLRILKKADGDKLLRQIDDMRSNSEQEAVRDAEVDYLVDNYLRSHQFIGAGDMFFRLIKDSNNWKIAKGNHAISGNHFQSELNAEYAIFVDESDVWQSGSSRARERLNQITSISDAVKKFNRSNYYFVIPAPGHSKYRLDHKLRESVGESMFLADTRTVGLNDFPSSAKQYFDLILTNHPYAALQQLIDAYNEGDIDNSWIEEKLSKIHRSSIIKERYKDDEKRKYKAMLTSYAYNVSKKTITIVKNESDIVPLHNSGSRHFYSICFEEETCSTFHEILDKYCQPKHLSIASDADAEMLIAAVDSQDVVIAGIFSPVDQRQENILRRLGKNSNLIAASFIPADTSRVAEYSKAYVTSYSNNQFNQMILPQALFGASEYRIFVDSGEYITKDASGVLGFVPTLVGGFDPSQLDEVDSIVNEGISRQAFPGCQIVVTKGGNVVYEKYYGNLFYDQNMPVEQSTIYDLASVTKVAATSLATMKLVDEGKIDIYKDVSYYLPELKGTNKEYLRLKDIMTHQAGLKSYAAFWKHAMDLKDVDFYCDHADSTYNTALSEHFYTTKSLSDSVWSWLKTSDLRKYGKQEDGSYSYLYSDLGFFMLKEVVERVSGKSLDEYVEGNFYDQMGMNHTGYDPITKFSIYNIAPTEIDLDLRNEMVWGYVHDRNAAIVGGVAGHAGLFSNALDMARLGNMLLQNGHYADQKFFSTKTVEDFTSKQFYKNRRGLGWDKPSFGENSNVSEYCSSMTFGHTGFTGTAIWIDPMYELVFVFLSNRVHPDAGNDKLNRLNIRRKIQDVVYKSMISGY